MNQILKIICVLRSGGDYNARYVRNMKIALDRILVGRTNWNLVCFTDKCEYIDGVELITLDMNYPGWWSKLEAFRYTGPCLFLDLDTVLTGKIDTLIDAIYKMDENDFFMLEPFNLTPSSRDGKWASGVMAWNGDWSEIFMLFNPETDIPTYDWDQRYITKRLEELNASVDSIQNHIVGLYSYKYHCKGTLPADASIVCFHGKPRPVNASWLGWVKKHWGA